MDGPRRVPRGLPRSHPAQTGFPAELVAPCGAEVVIRPEGLIQRGNQVEEGLAAALVAQRALVLTSLALTQSAEMSQSAWPG